MPKEIRRFEGNYYFLSNFSNDGFEYDNIYYPTNEHFFQAMKVLDNDTRKKIAAADTPSKAKKMGRKVKLRANWDKLRHRVMKKGLYEKFSQNPTIKAKLISTGNKTLIEGNTWHDNAWGNCRCKRCKNKEGKNYLGKYLMELREYFKESE